MSDFYRDMRFGVYRVAGSSEYASGSLYTVLQVYCEHQLMYLDCDMNWCPVNVLRHQHYHGSQQLTLLSYMHTLDCPSSDIGYTILADHLSLPMSRIKNALRSPITKGYRPFSESAFRFIQYQFALLSQS